MRWEAWRSRRKLRESNWEYFQPKRQVKRFIKTKNDG